VKAKYALPEAFLFYPARFWRHKNHLKLLEAFARISGAHPDVHLVFTGDDRPFSRVVRRKIEELGLSSRVLVLGCVDYGDLPALYRLSRMLVLPTLFESISIPIYEAFALKVPVCCSNKVGLPEQVGEAAVLFDPEAPEDIADKVISLLKDDALRERLALSGYERISHFDHEGYARGLREVLERASRE
jgi:glycosyltransferase involved in cell wall biosynthesis